MHTDAHRLEAGFYPCLSEFICGSGSFFGFGDILAGVRGRDKRRLELRWWQVDALLQHVAMERREFGRVRALGGIPVRYRLVREEPREHGPHAVHGNASG